MAKSLKLRLQELLDFLISETENLKVHTVM